MEKYTLEPAVFWSWIAEITRKLNDPECTEPWKMELLAKHDPEKEKRALRIKLD